jgi:hypothetical protein
MGRLLYLLVLLGACSYSVPPAEQVGDDNEQPREDAAIVDPDGPPPDLPVVPPDTPPPDGPPAPQTTDHVASLDNYIDAISFNQSSNFGATTQMFVDGSPAANVLMKFDLSGLPTETTVTAVELHVFTAAAGGAITVFPMLESWTETTSTWRRRNTNTAWTAVGAGPGSRGATAIATFTPNAANAEFTADVDVATVQGWVTDPDSNLGLVFTSVSSDESLIRSSESATGKPFLRITHTP